MILLKDLRLENGLTQSAIANAIGISRQVYANYENEINQPDCKMLVKLASFFEVSVDYLLGLEDDFGVRVPATSVTEHYSKEEKELIEKYRRLDPRIKKLICDQLDIYVGNSEIKIKNNKKV